MVIAANLWIPFLILIPNLLLILAPPIKAGKMEPVPRKSFWLAEHVGRIGVLLLPLFSAVRLGTVWEFAGLMLMVAALALYYAGWFRFFASGRAYVLLYRPVLGLPVPLAVAPVLYFAGASVVLQSWPMSLSTLVLAVGHIPASLNLYRGGEIAFVVRSSDKS